MELTKNFFLVIFFCLFMLNFLSTVSLAQSADDDNKTKHEYPNNELEFRVRYIPSVDAESQAGDIEAIEVDSKYTYQLKAFGKLPLTVGLRTKYIDIENTTQVILPEHLTGLTTDIETTLPFFNFPRTYFRVGISPSFYGDDWDFQSSNFRLPFHFYATKQVNQKLTLLAGIAVFPKFENEVWPILGFIYKANEKLSFNLVPGQSNINYQLSNKITLFAEGGFSRNEFEVNFNDQKNVILLYREARIGSGIRYQLNKFIQTSLSVGKTLNRTFKYRDDLGKINLENGIYTEFRAVANF